MEETYPYPRTTASQFTTVVLVGLMAATIFGLLGLFISGLSHNLAIPAL